MKKRIALVSYSDCTLTAYQVHHTPSITQVFATGDAYSPQDAGNLAAEVAEDGDGVLVTVPNGTEYSKIRLNALEAQRLLTALLAHNRLRDGLNVEFYKKG